MPDFSRITVDKDNCLPAGMYTDPEVFNLELECIYRQSWISVGFASQISAPGDVVPVSVAGIPLLLVRNTQGEIGVFHNICRHRGFNLVISPCSRKNALLTCPYHGWSYTLDGELQTAPHWEKSVNSGPDEETRSKLGLVSVSFAVWCDIIFVNLDGNAEPFEDFISPLKSRWRHVNSAQLGLAGITRFEPAANWKLAVENFLDFYHLPFVHRQLSRGEDAVRVQDAFLSDDIFGAHYPRGATDKPKTPAALPIFPAVPENLLHAQDLFCIFPNTLVFAEPSWMQVISLQPETVSASTEQLAVYLVGDAAMNDEHAASRETLVALLNDINYQDVATLESLQTGRASPAASDCRFAEHWDQAGILFQQRILHRISQQA